MHRPHDSHLEIKIGNLSTAVRSASRLLGRRLRKPVQISGLEKASEIKADVTAARDDIRAVTAPSRRTNYALVVIARVFSLRIGINYGTL
jgi:hypothetical protein